MLAYRAAVRNRALPCTVPVTQGAFETMVAAIIVTIIVREDESYIGIINRN